MKVYAFILLLAFSFVECRKVLRPLEKSANIDFINMESGGLAGPSQVNPAPAKPAPVQPAPTTPKPVPSSPQVQPAPTPAKPVPMQPTAAPKPPSHTPIPPKPVYPPHSATPITTPGPGSVKQLVNFYDSQGKASPIRPYSYSQAVKQG